MNLDSVPKMQLNVKKSEIQNICHFAIPLTQGTAENFYTVVQKKPDPCYIFK